MNKSAVSPSVAVVGAGPAGLMAAEVVSAAGLSVTVYDRMPSAGRKLLMAGRGGLNLTHSEPLSDFVGRYGDAADWLRAPLDAFPPAALQAWADGLGQATFVGSSGRVFPRALKASPLLRAWLHRLRAQHVTLRFRHEWRGWSDDGALVFGNDSGSVPERPAATILALGGGSWPRLGSSGAWVAALAAAGIGVAPLTPANSGFSLAWSPVFAARFAGAPLKSVVFSAGGRRLRGEAVITRYGIEGGAIYALGTALRAALMATGTAILLVDLKPDLDAAQVAARLARARSGQSLANVLRKALHLSPLQANLLREVHGAALARDPAGLAAQIKALPLRLTGVQGLERAISSAGGIRRDEVDAQMMLRRKPGTFVAGEMLDWEAPTGGYLLQATLATGVAAGRGVLRWLAQDPARSG